MTTLGKLMLFEALSGIFGWVWIIASLAAIYFSFRHLCLPALGHRSCGLLAPPLCRSGLLGASWRTRTEWPTKRN